MIPVGVRNKNVRVDGALFEFVGHKPVAQGFNPRAKINDNRLFIGPDFKAGGVPAVDNRILPRAGDGTPGSPNSYAQHGYFSPLLDFFAFSHFT
jgi:hypothetical protein